MKSFVSKWAAWLVAGATLLIWLPAVFNNFVEWDDAIFITSNPRFNPPTWGTICYYWSHAGSNLYIPITYTFWAVLARVGQVSTPDMMGTQLNPYLFHLGQVAMHIIATVAVFGILKRVLGSIGAAMAGAMLFAVHPLQVQAVAFIGATNTPLAGALALTAIWLQGNGEKKWKWAAAVLFALAMLAKPTAVVAPAILILLDVIVEKRTVRQAIGNALPWIILVIPCLIWTKMIQSHAANDAGPIWSRPLIAGDAMFFYVRKFFYPWPMAIDYGRTTKEALGSAMIWWAWLVPGGAGCCGLAGQAAIATGGGGDHYFFCGHAAQLWIGSVRISAYLDDSGSLCLSVDAGGSHGAGELGEKRAADYDGNNRDRAGGLGGGDGITDWCLAGWRDIISTCGCGESVELDGADGSGDGFEGSVAGGSNCSVSNRG